MSVYPCVAIVSTGAVVVFANISALPAQAGSDRNHGCGSLRDTIRLSTPMRVGDSAIGRQTTRMD